MPEKKIIKSIASKKRKKPRFARQNMHRKVKVKDSWRAPKGEDSKQRLGKKSRGKCPNPGYRQPKKIRGLHPSGFEEVLIRSLRDIEGVKPEMQALRLASCLGKKKRGEILNAAQAKYPGIKILNA